MRLCVVVVECCVFLRIIRSFNEFLTEAGKGSDEFPKTLDEVSKAGIRLVLADATDPDGVGFVQWRVAFYVAGEDGSVLNFFNLFDDFLVWKSKAMAKDIDTHLWPHIGIDELEQSKIEEELSYNHYTVHAPAQESEMPLKWHEACPCIGKREATVHLTAASDTELKLIWSGNTWVFRDAMDEAGIKGRRYSLCARVHVCMCACVRVCLCARVRVCVCACACQACSRYLNRVCAPARRNVSCSYRLLSLSMY